MVCEKVAARGTTTYTEVADELVQDFLTGTLMGELAGGLSGEQGVRATGPSKACEDVPGPSQTGCRVWSLW